MAEEKETKRSVDMTPAVNAALFRELGLAALNRSFDLVEKMIEAGKTDLMQGYASSLMASDLMHSAGLLSDQAYGSIFIMENIMEGIAGLGSVIGSVFGAASPFAPSLKTLIDNRAASQREEREQQAEAASEERFGDIIESAQKAGAAEVEIPGRGRVKFRYASEEAPEKAAEAAAPGEG